MRRALGFVWGCFVGDVLLGFFSCSCHPGLVLHARNINFILFSEYESPHFEMVHLFSLQVSTESILLN